MRALGLLLSLGSAPQTMPVLPPEGHPADDPVVWWATTSWLGILSEHLGTPFGRRSHQKKQLLRVEADFRPGLNLADSTLPAGSKANPRGSGSLSICHKSHVRPYSHASANPGSGVELSRHKGST